MTRARIRYVCRAISGCSRPSVLTLPVPLCRVHAAEVTRGMLAGTPDRSHAAPARPWDREATRLALPVALPVELPRSHAPVVYFVQNGSLVKIGWSTNLRARLSALCLRRMAVLLAVAGDNALEAALHRTFWGLRQEGTEWFRYEQPLSDYIQELRNHAHPVNLTDLTEMLGETGANVVTEDEPEEQPQTLLDVPREKTRMPLDEAQQILTNGLEDLSRAGVHEFDYAAFRDIPEVTGWPKGWVYLQLAEAVDSGRLDQTSDGWKFRECGP